MHASMPAVGDRAARQARRIADIKASLGRGTPKEPMPQALNVLASAKEHLGSLDRVTRVVRLGAFMATFGDFFDQPKVADAVSDLFRDVGNLFCDV